MFKRIVRAALVGGVLVASSGCATWGREGRLHAATERHLYSRPASEVWPLVRAFMEEQGLDYKSSKDQYALVTDWKESFQGNRVASSSLRYYVTLIPHGADACELRVYMQSVFTGGRGSPVGMDQTFPQLLSQTVLWPDGEAAGFRRVFRRNLPMEWELLKRIEPQSAQVLSATTAHAS